jgi:ABC-type antimicrobial peptide transport system permease subunit
VILMVLREGGRIVLVGVALGVAGALALGRSVQSILHGTTPTDLVTYTGVSVLVLAIAFLACLAPSRRAAAVNPTDALKFE